jgi:hypothetical protein
MIPMFTFTKDDRRMLTMIPMITIMKKMLLTNDDDREQQCVVLELKTTAIVVFRSNT